jgi:GT2 family glycosyltransferase
MTAPWLSVVMPTFNGGTYLSTALDSILSQAEEGIEVIAVDDGSTDDTVPILRKYADRMPLKLVEQQRIGNWVVGTNRGIELATGEYVSFLHQDDAWMPGRLRLVKQGLEAAAPSLFLHPVWFIDSIGKRVGRWTCPLPAEISLSPDLVTERLLVQNFISIPGTIFQRATALELGGLDEKLWYTADWDLWLRIARRGTTLYMAKTLAAFRVHQMAMTATRSTRLSEFRRQLETVLERHLAEWQAHRTTRKRVEAAARFSVEVNVALAALVHRRPTHLGRLGLRLLSLGPSGLVRYLRDSRIGERTAARLRTGMGWRVVQPS